ncbi:MAG: hypothetical protein ABSE99_17235 [Terracidiphilus sp.]|jgi:hypothetical protein
MPPFTDWRITACAAHRLRFNGEEAACPDCAYGLPAQALAAAPRPGGWAGLLKFRCPFCGSKSIREESCSRYACRVQSSLSPRKALNQCRNCGGQTKNPEFCTRYPCRQAAGTQSMYNRRAQ